MSSNINKAGTTSSNLLFVIRKKDRQSFLEYLFYEKNLFSAYDRSHPVFHAVEKHYLDKSATKDEKFYYRKIVPIFESGSDPKSVLPKLEQAYRKENKSFSFNTVETTEEVVRSCLAKAHKTNMYVQYLFFRLCFLNLDQSYNSILSDRAYINELRNNWIQDGHACECEEQMFYAKFYELTKDNDISDFSGMIFPTMKIDIMKKLTQINTNDIINVITLAFCQFKEVRGHALNFADAEFKTRVDFRGSEFFSNVHFDDCTIPQPTFNNTHFKNRLQFNNAKIKKIDTPIEAILNENQEENSVAKDDVDIFKFQLQSMSFDRVEFDGRVEFDTFSIEVPVSFVNTIFNDNAHIVSSELPLPQLYINLTKFRRSFMVKNIEVGRMVMLSCEVDSSLVITASNISGDASLEGSSIGTKLILSSKFKYTPDIRHTVFEHKYFRFVNFLTPNFKTEIDCLSKTVKDEERFTAIIKQLHDRYKVLKVIATAAGDLDARGKYFINENNIEIYMRQSYKEYESNLFSATSNSIKLVVLLLYRLFSNFGFSIIRPIAILICLFFSALFLDRCFSLSISTLHFIVPFYSFKDLMDYSGVWTLAIMLLVKLVVIVLWFLFGLALRNNLKVTT